MAVFAGLRWLEDGSTAVQFRVQPLVFLLDHVMDSFLKHEGGGKVPIRFRHDWRKSFNNDSLRLVKMETTVWKAFISGDAAWIDGNAQFHGESEDSTVETVHVARARTRAFRKGDDVYIVVNKTLKEFRIFLQRDFRGIQVARQTCVVAEERELHWPAVDDLDGFNAEESHEKGIRSRTMIANVNTWRRVGSSFVSILDADEWTQPEVDDGASKIQNDERTHVMFPQPLGKKQDA